MPNIEISEKKYLKFLTFLVDMPVPLSMAAGVFFNVAPFRISASNWERLVSFIAAEAILKLFVGGVGGGGGGGGGRKTPSDIFK